MLTWTLENTLVALILAVIVALLCRGLRARPAVCHLLWTLVLVALLVPPLPFSPLPAGDIRPTLSSGLWQLAQFAEPGDSEMNAVPADEETLAKKAAGAVTKDDSQLALAPLAPTPTSSGSGTTSGVAGIGTWSPYLLGAWLLGSVLVAGFLARRIGRFHAFVRNGGDAPPELLLSIRSVASRLGVKPPKVVMLPELKTPMVWSLGRPLILWPGASSAPEEIAERRSIIAHELAHLRRRDHWIAWLEMAGMVVCWWNPVFWLTRNRMRHHAELACDAWAVWAFPQRRRAYAEALIHALKRYSSPPLAGAALGIADAARKSFRRRLTMIMAPRVSRRVSAPWAIAALLVMMLIVPGWSREETPEPVGNLLDDRVKESVSICIDKLHAKRYLKSGEFEKAADAYRRIVAHDPLDGGAWNGLGRAQLELGETAAAIAAFEKQEALGKNAKESRLAVALAYAKSGKTEASLAALEKALAAGFHDVGDLEDEDEHEELKELFEGEAYAKVTKACSEAKAIAKKAAYHYEKGEWAEAAEAAERAAIAMPECGKTHHVLGVSLIGAGKVDAAYEVLRRQEQLGFKPGIAHYNMACCQSLAGNTEKALEHLAKSIALGFRDPELMAKDGDLDNIRESERFQGLFEKAQEKRYSAKAIDHYLETGEYAKAAEALEAMSRDEKAHSDESRGWACAELGETLLKLGKAEAALEAYHRQAELGHDVPEALRGAATAYAQSGNADRAFAYLQGAIEAGYHDIDSIREDSNFESLHGDPRFKNAVQSAIDGAVLDRFHAVNWEHLHARSKKAARENPDDGQAFYTLGWANLRLGNMVSAAEAFQRQEKLGFAPLIARYNAACCYAMLDRKDEAFAWLDKAVEGGLDDPRQVAHDPDLSNLRGDPRFASFVERVKENAKKHKKEKKHDYEGEKEKEKKKDKKKKKEISTYP